MRLKREAPPNVHRPRAGRPVEWPKLFAGVRQAAGDWCVFPNDYATRESARSAANYLRLRYAADVADIEFAVRAKGGKGVIYARLKTA